MSDIDSLVKQFKNNALSRRRFIQGASALGVAAPAAAGILSMAGAAKASEPKRGGWLRIAEGNTADTLEPVRMTSTTDAIYANQIYSRLTKFSADLKPEGDLASEWSVDSTAKVWTFKLRANATFHNGKDVTAEDVKESLTRHIAEGSESAAKAILSGIASMDVIDSKTIKITLSGGNADLPVTMSDYHLSIHPAGQTEFGAAAIGSGPFKISEFQPGERVVFERYDNYFISGQPYLDGLDFIPVPDSTANMNAILSGDVDVIHDIPPHAFDKMSQASGLEVYNIPTGSFVNFCLMADRAPTNDINFRKGFKHAMDRELIMNQVYKGIGTIAADTPFGPTYRYHCKDVVGAEYDLDKAKHYFKKAGVSSMEIFTSEEACATAPDVGLTYQQGAKGAIDVKVTKAPSDGYWSHTWMQKPINMSGWNARPTVDAFLSIAHMNGGSWNETVWGSEMFDNMIITARAELDTTKRAQMYCDIQAMLNDEGGFACSNFQNQLEATSSRVRGYIPHSVGSMGGFLQCSAGMWIEE